MPGANFCSCTDWHKHIKLIVIPQREAQSLVPWKLRHCVFIPLNVFPMYMLVFVLFDFMLYVHGKQLRSCWDCQLLNHTVPGQASQR